MRKLLALVIVVLATFVFVGATEFVTLKEYDPDAYADMVDTYVDAGFTEDEAVEAADRITVDGVYPSDLVTPTPAPTPTPTVSPTGTCTQEEWETVINAAAALGVSPLLQLSSACNIGQ